MSADQPRQSAELLTDIVTKAEARLRPIQDKDAATGQPKPPAADSAPELAKSADGTTKELKKIFPYRGDMENMSIAEIESRRKRRGHSLGVLTPGGDAQGMNAAVRAVVRMGLFVGFDVYFIYEGYQGMIDGGKNIVKATWSSVSGIIQKGGTIIGSSRCKEIRERSGRLKAAKNLVLNRITNLVCIGGDGTLTAANVIRTEWTYLLDELVSTGQITKDQRGETGGVLSIVGVVGSIDNDFCGTDMTVGADSAMHRIIECADAITTTAQSHQRAFILEVMGRNCGYLALAAALATEADWVFIPEWPPEANWPDLLCEKLKAERDLGQRLNIIIFAEGAIDRNGAAITSETVRKVVQDRLKFDTRVTVLGHVQRGGNPSAFSRILGSRMGAEAVMALLDQTPTSEPVVVSLDGNQSVRVPLMQCVEQTRAVTEAVKNKDWAMAVQLRGRSFARNLATYKMLTKLRPPADANKGQSWNIGVVNVGAPCCGINAAVRSVVRNALYKGSQCTAIYDGMEGFAAGRTKSLGRMDVSGWTFHGGSKLGIKRTLPDRHLPAIAQQILEKKLDALVVVGGFEAFVSVLHLAEARKMYREFCIPMVVLPATISNNVPGTDFTVGADSALNEICQMCDKLKQSATGTKRRVFVVETMGGFCGYLATMAGLASGSDAAYINEEPFSVSDLQRDVRHLAAKMADDVQRGMVIRAERAHANYTTDFITRLFSEEGKNVFNAREAILGHVQQGGSPTPYDRNLGTKLAARAVEHIIKQLQQSREVSSNSKNQQQQKSELAGSGFDAPESATLLGVVRREVLFTPVQKLKMETDFERRRPLQQWWMSLRPLLRILAKHESVFVSTGMEISAQEAGANGVTP